MGKITTLILDAGGVLVYPVCGAWNIPAGYRELLGAYAADIPGERWLAAAGKHASILREDVFVDGLEEEYRLRRQFLCEVARELDWQLSEEQLSALAEDFTGNVSRYGWYEDADPMLHALAKDYKIGILSDTMPSLHTVVQAHASRDCYSALVFSTEIGVAKPDARMYQQALIRLNAAPEECVFVDDREGNLRGAIACGIRAVQMCRDDAPCWDGPVVHNLSELKTCLEEMQ